MDIDIILIHSEQCGRFQRMVPFSAYGLKSTKRLYKFCLLSLKKDLQYLCLTTFEIQQCKSK
jgi:hypothetical protein